MSNIHKKAIPNKPIYLVNKTSPLIERYKDLAAMFENNKTFKTLVLDINPDVVSSLDNGLITELMVALQHYPHILEQLVFSFEFKFAQIADSELYFQESDWKTDKAYYRWFNKLSDSPAAIFFIHDQDARLYTLAGDLLADGKCTAQRNEGEKRSTIGFGAKEIELLCGRLFESCWFFHLYCHGSGFDPKPVIEAILAEFDLPISYQDIRKQYLKDVINGIEFRVGTNTGKIE
ncbi:MAG: hypothetical protein ACYDCN_03550 [Bacteroidia bacterium]